MVDAARFDDGLTITCPKTYCSGNIFIVQKTVRHTVHRSAASNVNAVVCVQFESFVDFEKSITFNDPNGTPWQEWVSVRVRGCVSALWLYVSCFSAIVVI